MIDALGRRLGLGPQGGSEVIPVGPAFWEREQGSVRSEGAGAIPHGVPGCARRRYVESLRGQGISTPGVETPSSVDVLP